VPPPVGHPHCGGQAGHDLGPLAAALALSIIIKSLS
jgi:hypothetical protein